MQILSTGMFIPVLFTTEKKERKENVPKTIHYSHMMAWSTDDLKKYCRIIQNNMWGVPLVAQQKSIQLVSLRTKVWSRALLSGLRIRCCCELRCRSKTQHRSGVAVAVVGAGSCSSDSIRPLAWELPYAMDAAATPPKKQNDMWKCSLYKKM